MKFEICHDAYERRGQVTEDGTLPLRSLKNGRDFFLKAAAAPLLELDGSVHDAETEFSALTPETRQDYLDGLTLLSAFGAARVLEETAESPVRIRVAGEKDYKAIAQLMNRENVLRLGKIPGDPTYMNEDNIRARQFNNDEYNFLYLRSGELRGVLLACMPSLKAHSVAFRLCGIAVEEGEDVGEIVGKLTDYCIREFSGEFRVIRYLCFREEDPLLPYLEEMGFTRSAYLEKEAEDGGDVAVFDKRILPC